MAIRRSVTVTCTTGGAATVYIPSSTSNDPCIQGKIYAVHYVKGTMSTGSDLTITAEAFTETVWTESNVAATKTVYPRRLVNNTAGGSTTLEREPIVVANDRLKIVVAQGGSGGTGTFSVVTDA